MVYRHLHDGRGRKVFALFANLPSCAIRKLWCAINTINTSEHLKEQQFNFVALMKLITIILRRNISCTLMELFYIVF